MLFDLNNNFFYTGSYSPGFTSGNFVSLVGVTSTGLGSSVINLTALEDMGIGSGVSAPKIAAYIGTGITCASSAMRVSLQFQGSTDSSNWTTYVETPASTTASFASGKVFPITLPHRSQGASLPQYYRLFLNITGTTTETISTGTILAGVVMQRDDNPIGQYASNFTVV